MLDGFVLFMTIYNCVRAVAAGVLSDRQYQSFLLEPGAAAFAGFVILVALVLSPMTPYFIEHTISMVGCAVAVQLRKRGARLF